MEIRKDTMDRHPQRRPCKFNYQMPGKDLNIGDAEGLFAGTPPLEALKPLLSDAASVDNARSRKVLMINFVSGAFFEAPMQRDLSIQPPGEDRREEDKRKHMAGHLNQRLYGT